MATTYDLKFVTSIITLKRGEKNISKTDIDLKD